MAIAGLDIGTTGCKCSVYTREGELIREAYEEYPPSQDGSIDAAAVFRHIKSVMREAASGEDVAGIGVTSFGESAVLLDKDDRPLTGAMTYEDKRGAAQAERLKNALGEEYIRDTTGLKPAAMYSLPKLMWIKENRPELFSRCDKVCLFGDYAVYMLSGKRMIDYPLATRTMALDIASLTWSGRMFQAAGIDPALMSRPVPVGTPAGRIKWELAEELGISANCVIVVGCHDQVAACVGTGTLALGEAVDGTGTMECITPVYGGDTDKRALTADNYAVIPFLSGKYVTYAFSFTGGALLKWYRDKLSPLEAANARAAGISPYEHFDGAMKDAPTGLLVLPHFAGAATPYMDDHSRGAIIGLTSETDKRDIYRALMEGVTYEMRLNMEHLASAGVKISSLTATGGGAGSANWLQMKADILGVRVDTVNAAQSGSLGCAMLAGVACGEFESLEAAAKVFVKKGRSYLPRSQAGAAYAELYKKYRGVYSAVKEFNS